MADDIAKVYQDQVTLVENDVLSLARAMPADRYGFAPADGVRTFGEQVTHLATMIYMTSARVMEEKSPYGPGTRNNGPDDVRTKDEVVEYLQGALVWGRRAMASLTAENHLDPVPTAFGPMPRVAVAAAIAYHSYNHYGQLVVYARLNGVVPPGSVPAGDEGRLVR